MRLSTNRDARARDVDARVILLQLEPDPRISKPSIVTSSARTDDHVRAAVADERGTAVTDERHRPGDVNGPV